MENLASIILLAAGFALGYAACYMNRLKDEGAFHAANGAMIREGNASKKRAIVLQAVDAYRKGETPAYFWQDTRGVMERVDRKEGGYSEKGRLIVFLNIGKNNTARAAFLTFEAARELPGIVEELEKGESSLRELTQGWESFEGGPITLEEIQKTALWAVEHYDVRIEQKKEE